MPELEPMEELEPEPLDEPEKNKPFLPPVPTREELLDDGFNAAQVAAILSHMQAMHDEVLALAKPVKLVRKPGLRIGCRNKTFWVCGHHLNAGAPWDVEIDKLSEANLVEIETVKSANLITVEEVELEVEAPAEE